MLPFIVFMPPQMCKTAQLFAKYKIKTARPNFKGNVFFRVSVCLRKNTSRHIASVFAGYVPKDQASVMRQSVYKRRRKQKLKKKYVHILLAAPENTLRGIHTLWAPDGVCLLEKTRSKKKPLFGLLYICAISHMEFLLAIWVVCMAKKTENVQFARRTQCAPKKLRDVCSSFIVVLLSPSGRLGS